MQGLGSCGLLQLAGRKHVADDGSEPLGAQVDRQTLRAYRDAVDKDARNPCLFCRKQGFPNAVEVCQRGNDVAFVGLRVVVAGLIGDGASVDIPQINAATSALPVPNISESELVRAYYGGNLPL